MKTPFGRRMAAVSLAVLVSALAACGGESSAPGGEGVVPAPKNLVNDGSLTYLTAATFPPFEFKDDDGLTGFDIEMAETLAGYMGLQPKGIDLDFDGLIPALMGKRADIINSAMYIKPEREEKVDFVPYLVIGESIVVRKGNPKGIHNVPEDLSGKTVAVTRGAIGERYMNDFNAELKAKGLPPMNIMALPTNQDALLAVRSGRADAFDTSTPGAAYTLTETGDEFEVAATFDVGTKIGIAVRKGDTEMKQAIEAAMEKFVSSGEYAKLLAKYNLPPETDYFATQGTGATPSPTSSTEN